MISPELITRIRHLFYAEHWKIGTIAAELDLHHQTIRQAVETDRFHRTQVLRPTKADPYIEFIQATLQQYPRLRATRIYQMLVVRGYTGGITQLRLLVARLRPQPREAFLRLRSFPGQEAQADWAHFWRSDDRNRTAPALLFRADVVLLAGAVFGVFLRPDSGKLPARSCRCLPGLGTKSTYRSLR